MSATKDENGSKTGSYKKSGVSTTEGHKKKHCDLCDKFSPRSSGTHNTIQCFKWNVDGTEKARRTDSGRGNIRDKSKRYSNAIKKAEKLKKKMKKMKRKNRNAPRNVAVLVTTPVPVVPPPLLIVNRILGAAIVILVLKVIN